MEGRYRAYSEHKDSGVEWLESVPGHWNLAKMTDLASTIKDQVLPADIKFETVIHYSIPAVQANGEGGEEDGDTIDSNKFKVEEGDVLYSKLNPRKQTVTVVSSHRGLVVSSTEFVVLRPKFQDQRYIYYLLLTTEIKQRSCSMVESATKSHERINPAAISKLKFPLPDKVERSKIGIFLDHETAKIDTLIEKQQQLITLLKEKRQAVISHAVTKGLNPDVPMRDSGVEWLGEVPAHWGITRLKYECSNIVDCLHSTPDYDEEGEFPAIRTADIQPGKLDVENARRVFEKTYAERNIRLTPRSGDIIYSREGERFGIAAVVPEGSSVCLGQRVMLFRTQQTPDFLMWSLNADATYKQAQQDTIGATSPHVNVETIKDFSLGWPPEDERNEIAEHIEKLSIQMSELVGKAETTISLLHERRTALISAAVTGKIDVRNRQTPTDKDIQ